MYIVTSHAVTPPPS